MKKKSVRYKGEGHLAMLHVNLYFFFSLISIETRKKLGIQYKCEVMKKGRFGQVEEKR